MAVRDLSTQAGPRATRPPTDARSDETELRTPGDRPTHDQTESVAEFAVTDECDDSVEKLLAAPDERAVLTELLDAVLRVQRAAMGSLQIVNPATGALDLFAHRGFAPERIEIYRSIDAGTEETFALRALRRRQSIVVQDVMTDPDYAPHRPVAHAVGFRAVHATPLRSRTDQRLGVVAALFPIPHRPSETQIHLTERYARCAAEVITRLRAQHALQQSEERFARAFHASPDGMVISCIDDGTICDVNDAYAAMLGFDRENLIGKTTLSLGIYPEPEQRRRLMHTLREQGTVRDFEMRVRRSTGEVRLFSVSSEQIHVHDEVMAVSLFRDITDQRRAQEALRASEAKFRSVFEQAAIGMGRVRFTDARWIDVNDAFCSMLGYTADELRRTPWPRITHPQDLEIDLIPFRRMAAGDLDTYTVEKRFIHKQGHPVWARLTLSLVRDAEGRPDYEIAIIEDIGARKHAEDALRELNATLESRVAERTAQLEHRARQLQKLSLDVSQAEDRERQRLAEILHDDLQQHLAGAKFHAGVLANRIKDDPRAHDMAVKLEAVIKEAAEKSRSLSHELRPGVLRSSDLAEILRWLAHRVHTQHGLSVQVAGDEVPVHSEALKSFLYKAARELLFNIVKHARTDRARIRLRHHRRYIALVVSDRGRGFDPQTLDATAGFGLITIRERVELLGGKMKIHSSPHWGSRFLIIVPAIPHPQIPPTEIRSIPSASAARPVRTRLPDENPNQTWNLPTPDRL